MRFVILCLLAFLLRSGVAQAEEPSATATLSSDTAAVGEAVELQISIQGTQKVVAPQVRVEGLEVRYAGESTQFQMNNFEVTRSVRYTYTVLPKKEGTFTIPSLQIDAGGKKITTQPLKFTVAPQAGGGQAGGSGTNTEKAETSFAFAEWVLPKTTAYVGEAIPAELRLYIDQRIQCQLQQMPVISGDGFIVQKMGQPQQRQITKDGRNLLLAIFKTAITPVKPGKLALPNADINAIAVVPTKRQRRPQIPGFPDAFSDPFFGGVTQQQVVIRPDAVEMEIKPLPTVGKPQSFSGAVGQFTLETKAAPLRVHTGDPVTVTAVVTGVGSFDRMSAPTLAEESGWRTYPASGKFKADDEVGISGAKTFEAAVIPEAAHAALPKIEFSFFNPSTERYETLTGDRIPLTVEGAAVSSPTPAAVAAVPSASPAATPEPKANDIQYIQIEPGARATSFANVWNTPHFWLVQLLPLAALLGLGGWQRRRLRLSDGESRRAANLRNSKAEALSVLRQEKTAAEDFYDAAVRAIQLETALGQLRLKRDPSTVDADTACACRTLDADTVEGIQRLFAQHDERRYAGVGSGGSSSSESIYPDQRARVLQIIEQFEKSHA